MRIVIVGLMLLAACAEEPGTPDDPDEPQKTEAASGEEAVAAGSGSGSLLPAETVLPGEGTVDAPGEGSPDSQEPGGASAGMVRRYAPRPLMDRPLGDPPPLVEESPVIPDLSSPEAALRSILEGRARGDLPFLARCGSSTAGKPRLDKEDAHEAHNTYCRKAMDPFWSRVRAALDDNRAIITIDGDAAKVSLDVGGAMGSIDLLFTRIYGHWHHHIGDG
jgi:hypothetical protein